MTLADLRRYAVARSLFVGRDLQHALDTFGFVQADPIQAPARAQDLALRHRVPGYRASDLERQYATLHVEEDFFINYGFVTPRVHALMHPRAVAGRWSAARRARAEAVLDFIRARRQAHPREVDGHFDHGRATNYWGGSSNATTLLLDSLHYRGLLRVVGREKGIRLYAVRDGASLTPPTRPRADAADAALDTLIDVLVGKYAPLPAATLSMLARRVRYGAPQLEPRIGRALVRAKARLAHARVDGVDWYWPATEEPGRAEPDDRVRLLAPFDPIVWDRRRFELLWGWAYRFEAYTPVAKRKLGYYALPLLWKDDVIGWANASVKGGLLAVETGYVSGSAPRSRAFKAALEREVETLRAFLM
ncbi:MAG: crosslink repair DNA glycosylase YcaQ family protein [Vicinamibacterales bacterium]